MFAGEHRSYDKAKSLIYQLFVKKIAILNTLKRSIFLSGVIWIPAVNIVPKVRDPLKTQFIPWSCVPSIHFNSKLVAPSLHS